LETAVLTDIHTSNTYPPLCSVSVKPGSLLCIGIEVEVLLETRDYNNETRKVGGDPVFAKVTGPSGALPETATSIEDNEDGTYFVRFVPPEEGSFKVHVEIFGRPIREESHVIEVSQHNNPLKTWGKGELCQPVSVARNDHGEIFLLDIGNSRIVVLDQNINIKRILENETLKVSFYLNFNTLLVNYVELLE
jgi:tripartite motif-containing protein 2/3